MFIGAPSGRLKVSHTHIAEVKESTRFNFTPSSGKIAELKLIKECQTKSTIYKTSYSNYPYFLSSKNS